MAVFMLPPIFYAMIKWPVEYGITNKKKEALIWAAETSYARASAVVMIGYTVLHFAQKLPETWGHDRALAFILGQCVFGAIIFLPLMFIPVVAKKKR